MPVGSIPLRTARTARLVLVRSSGVRRHLLTALIALRSASEKALSPTNIRVPARVRRPGSGERDETQTRANNGWRWTGTVAIIWQAFQAHNRCFRGQTLSLRGSLRNLSTTGQLRCTFTAAISSPECSILPTLSSDSRKTSSELAPRAWRRCPTPEPLMVPGERRMS